ncbi:MAG: glucosamine-6-phosphate deaminase [Candidatus Aminicenantes bacterium]|nr:MAG: glucosamine-6-phosphate deaminase [Candidatus Aminicenantes bacterium]
MEVIIFETPEKVFDETAARIINLIQKKRNAVLGLATGRTMEGVYQRLVAAYQAGKVDFSGVTTFNLDEYLGLDPADPRSFRAYMERHLFSRVNLNPERTFIPRSRPEDVAAECRRYEALIKEKGGIDLQLLGIGRDGHIGFNEPSSSLAARTRIKTLTDETLLDNFGTLEAPRFAITLGIGTILEAREIILLAFGEKKAEAIAWMVEGPVSASCPASALQLHPVVRVIIDEAAASRLQRKDYYLWVWRHKKQAEELSFTLASPQPEDKPEDP